MASAVTAFKDKNGGSGPYDARAVANALIERATANGQGLDPQQIIKLVYICHAWTLALDDHPLIDEAVLAWQHGPVIRSVRECLIGKDKDNPIQTQISEHTALFGEDARSIINEVCDKYGHLPGQRLSEITHQKGSPWGKAWGEFVESGGYQQKKEEAEAAGSKVIIVTEIPNDLIQSHFRALASNAEQEVSAKSSPAPA